MKIRLSALLFIALLGIGVVSFFPGHGASSNEIIVDHGSNLHRVGDQLVQQGLVFSRWPLLFWARVRQADSKIQFGLYRFPKWRSSFWILDDMINGRTEKVKLVIPEGFASWQIAERLQQLRVCKAQDFLNVVHQKSLEGFLFPATYDMNLGRTADQVAQQLKEQFDKNWTPEMTQRAQQMGLTQLQVVTMASIIEREVRARDELPIVASVYYNRLKINKPLQADPTVQYAQGFWNRHLTYKDYNETNSPYNTYRHKGLPPGPICNPGRDAIKAALYPATTEWLYFVAAENGHHSFSKSYRDHTNKVNRRNRQKQRANR